MADPHPLSIQDVSEACSCGCVDEGIPTFDVRDISHHIRHATVFGALKAILAGGSMDLIAAHDPQPLLAQISKRDPRLLTGESGQPAC